MGHILQLIQPLGDLYGALIPTTPISVLLHLYTLTRMPLSATVVALKGIH